MSDHPYNSPPPGSRPKDSGLKGAGHDGSGHEGAGPADSGHAGAGHEGARPADGTSHAGAFEPRVIAFCCQYCAYSAADMAGSMRLQYPPNVEIVLVPCTGRFDVILALKALESGADGIYAAGCIEGSCHFLDGNVRARRRIMSLQKELEGIGVDPRRVEMYNLSASQGPRFAEIAREFSQRITGLGPGPSGAARHGDDRSSGLRCG